MVRRSSKTRLQRKREKDSLRQAFKYFVLLGLLLFLMIRFGVPGLIRMAAFIGDIRSSKQPIEQQDLVPVLAPRLNPLPEATSSAELNVSGYGESGETVKLYVNGIEIEEMVVGTEREFEFKDVHFKEGKNEVYAVSVDDKGKVSDNSNSWIVIMDATEPFLEIISPEDRDKFFDNDSPIKVSGETEENVSLTVNSRFVLVKSNGEFETQLSLSEGDNYIEVKAVDKAGNETVKQVVVNYTP